MKKIAIFLVAAILLSILAGCNNTPKKVSEPRVKLLYEDEGDGLIFDSWTGYFDFDNDETKERVKVRVLDPDDKSYSQYLNVKIGEFETTIEGVDRVHVEAIYGCDIDPNDGAWDLAVFTIEQSADPRVFIFKYNENLEPYVFWGTDYNGEEAGENCYWLGYIDKPYFDITADNKIILRTQTGSRGMWYVNRIFSLDDRGRISEEKQELYEILPDFMLNSSLADEFNAEEKQMWDKGYIKANISLDGNSIDLMQGEYFKVLYDDDNNNLFIEKENGENGWINLDSQDVTTFIDLNLAFFFMAG